MNMFGHYFFYKTDLSLFSHKQNCPNYLEGMKAGNPIIYSQIASK